MLLVIFSAPACLLSFYLAYLCYRNACYRQTLALTLVAVLLLAFTLGMLGAGYFSGVALQEELANL